MMGENFFFLDIFDTCDGSYNLSISLLPPIVLDNLFGFEGSISTIKLMLKLFHRICQILFAPATYYTVANSNSYERNKIFSKTC